MRLLDPDRRGEPAVGAGSGIVDVGPAAPRGRVGYLAIYAGWLVLFMVGARIASLTGLDPFSSHVQHVRKYGSGDHVPVPLGLPILAARRS